MSEIQSTRDAILLGIPMLGLLVLNVFRLDHVLAQRKRLKDGSLTGHPLSQVRASGRVQCVEPDGRQAGRRLRGSGTAYAVTASVRRVTAVWSEKDCWE